MALSEETRAGWILARLGGAPAPDDAPFPEAEASERAELLRDSSECRDLWMALDRLDEPIATEAPSPGAREAFASRLAGAIRQETRPRASGSRPAAISRWVPRPAFLFLAASLALVAFLVLSPWKKIPPPPAGLPPQAGTGGAAPGPELPSASSRLAAVLARPEGREPAEARELGRILQNDPNPNVRLAALEVLSRRFAKDALEGRIAPALAREADPLVRLELIRTIGERNLVRDSRALRDFALDPRLDDLARDEIARVRERLGT